MQKAHSDCFLRFGGFPQGQGLAFRPRAFKKVRRFAFACLNPLNVLCRNGVSAIRLAIHLARTSAPMSFHSHCPLCVGHSTDFVSGELSADRARPPEKSGKSLAVRNNSGNRSGSCSENCSFRIAQVVGRHSENGISHSENEISNSESCSENTPELSQSFENDLSSPRAFFLKLGWFPGF